MPTDCPTNLTHWIRVVAISMIALASTVAAQDVTVDVNQATETDRCWLINTRGLTSSARCADLDRPALSVSRLDCRGSLQQTTLEDYLRSLNPLRSVVIYVHGNRMEACEARLHGMQIYRLCRSCPRAGAIDWVIWSWPSEQAGILTRDVRIKASRTDAQGLYLAWLLREHHGRSVSATLIGYSFGGRVVTGALHAMAGGSLARRSLTGPAITGGSIGVGLIAPAIDSHWLTEHGYHAMATQNMQRMVLMYNRRDIVLKRYWLIDKVRGRMALGYSGPTAFACRADGSQLPVRSRDCSTAIGKDHDELDYFIQGCRTGPELASLIDDIQISL